MFMEVVLGCRVIHHCQPHLRLHPPTKMFQRRSSKHLRGDALAQAKEGSWSRRLVVERKWLICTRSKMCSWPRPAVSQLHGFTVAAARDLRNDLNLMRVAESAETAVDRILG